MHVTGIPNASAETRNYTLHVQKNHHPFFSHTIQYKTNKKNELSKQSTYKIIMISHN